MSRYSLLMGFLPFYLQGHSMIMEIFVKQLQFVGKHGVYKEEREDGRRFCVDVVVTVKKERKSREDSLDLTVDYRTIAETVLRHGQGPSVQLVETLVERIVEDLYALSVNVMNVDLTLAKRATGVIGDPEWVGVRSVTRREDFFKC